MPESTETTFRLAIYARVSTEEQREGQNIDSQVAELERFSRDKCWPIVGTYKDEGWSGGVMERPELDRLRDDAVKDLFDAALINDVDRLARDVSHLGIIKRDLERKGVKVIFRKLPSDASATSNLMVNILGSFAEFERELIADRTRRGRRHKVEVRKEYLGSNTAYGYRYTPKDHLAGKNGILDVVPTEASVIRRMFEWVDQDGLSARRVVRRLSELNIPPKKGASAWSKSSVLRILHNEMYAGVWHYNKFQGCEPKNPLAGPRYRKRSKCSHRQRPKKEWLPLLLPAHLHLIPRDRWERVQSQLTQNISFSPRNEKHSYLLKGLVECGGCGSRYVGDPCHGKFYYRCSARCKKQPTVSESLLDCTVKKAVEDFLIDPALILKPLQRLNRASALEEKQRTVVAREAEQELTRLQSEEQRILDAYRTNLISPIQLGQQLEKINLRRAQLSVANAEANPVPAMPPEQLEKSITDYCADAALNMAKFTLEGWTKLLRTVIHRITFEGDHITIEGQIPITESAEHATINIGRRLN